jgi:hypothetical protein
MYPPDKNPLHPSALRMRDMRLGKQVLVFNTQFGHVVHRGTIVREPYILRDELGSTLVVDIRAAGTGHVSDSFLADMGVVPYDGSFVWGWNPTNFTISAQKQHLLPQLVGAG